jgi:FixJ family two-component response regulator
MDAAGIAGPGKGTGPLLRSESAAERLVTEAGGAGHHPVAVVDDDDSVRRSLERLLAAGGIPTVAFASAEDYLARGAGGDFRCLLLDVHLDGISGIQLAAGLAARGESVPIIFLTGSDDEPATAAVAAGHAAAVLRKPVDAAALRAAITRATPAPP